MGHDMDRPASRPWLVGTAAGIHRQRVEAGADAGIGTEQRDRSEFLFGFLDDVADIAFLRDIAFERCAIDASRDRLGAGMVEIDHDHLGCASAMKGFAECAADAIGATGHDHDLAGHLHRLAPLLVQDQVKTRSITAV